MTPLATVNSEYIKLTTTRSPYWCAAVVVALSLGISVLIGAVLSSTPDTGLGIADYLLGLNQFGVIVLMIMAVLAVTSEYRFGTIRTTFTATPRRRRVLIAKAVVFGGLAVVLSAVLAVISLGVVKALAGSSSNFSFGDADALRQIWGTPIWALLCVIVGLGVGALIRHTAGAVVIILVWMLVAESILAVLPKVGPEIGPFLPFRNGSRFLTSTASSPDYHWNAYVSLAYFAVFAAVVFVAAIAVVERRDA
ncbi:putative ABC transporter permease protein [Gordonia effusa NBRC 100432]|uniref:Putative ABC transporter permease protein n=1 Tax=Gordonia effusa NBRC 100432 TaxID=1077974 RepID=H0QYT0_9ACTN|nr:ABC transporter permease subunit [Gordonia effusa]GAB17981.1 putative ABC transporter permease protein [Gordonia effusa NBRC 100432]